MNHPDAATVHIIDDDPSVREATAWLLRTRRLLSQAHASAAAFEQAPRLLGEHGMIVFTDVMALEGPESNGGVLNPADRSDKAVAMRTMLDEVQSDERFISTFVPVGTGMLIAIKND